MKLREEARRTRDAIIRELERHGVTDYAVVMRGRHPAVEFTVQGATHFVTFSTTRTDHRARHNQVAMARRIAEGRHRHRGKDERITECSSSTH